MIQLLNFLYIYHLIKPFKYRNIRIHFNYLYQDEISDAIQFNAIQSDENITNILYSTQNNIEQNILRSDFFDLCKLFLPVLEKTFTSMAQYGIIITIIKKFVSDSIYLSNIEMVLHIIIISSRILNVFIQFHDYRKIETLINRMYLFKIKTFDLIMCMFDCISIMCIKVDNSWIILILQISLSSFSLLLFHIFRK